MPHLVQKAKLNLNTDFFIVHHLYKYTAHNDTNTKSAPQSRQIYDEKSHLAAFSKHAKCVCVCVQVCT